MIQINYLLSFAALIAYVGAIPRPQEVPIQNRQGQVGEICGGIGGLECDEGLVCIVDNPQITDAMGKCQYSSQSTKKAGRKLKKLKNYRIL
jgi:hypothetical protein